MTATIRCRSRCAIRRTTSVPARFSGNDGQAAASTLAMEGDWTMRTRWKWVALAGTAAMTLGCPARYGAGSPGDRDGSSKDADHQKVCAQKHPLFPPSRQVKGQPGKDGAPPAPPGAARSAAQPLVTESTAQFLVTHGGGGD